jgi:hypothetical protein
VPYPHGSHQNGGCLGKVLVSVRRTTQRTSNWGNWSGREDDGDIGVGESFREGIFRNIFSSRTPNWTVVISSSPGPSTTSPLIMRVERCIGIDPRRWIFRFPGKSRKKKAGKERGSKVKWEQGDLSGIPWPQVTTISWPPAKFSGQSPDLVTSTGVPSGPLT